MGCKTSKLPQKSPGSSKTVRFKQEVVVVPSDHSQDDLSSRTSAEKGSDTAPDAYADYHASSSPPHVAVQTDDLEEIGRRKGIRRKSKPGSQLAAITQARNSASVTEWSA